MRTLIQQLYAAYKCKDWTMAEFCRRSGLKLDPSTLRRQLIGETPMNTVVCEVLAKTLDVTIAVVPNDSTGAT